MCCIDVISIIRVISVATEEYGLEARFPFSAKVKAVDNVKSRFCEKYCDVEGSPCTVFPYLLREKGEEVG